MWQNSNNPWMIFTFNGYTGTLTPRVLAKPPEVAPIASTYTSDLKLNQWRAEGVCQHPPCYKLLEMNALPFFFICSRFYIPFMNKYARH